MTLFGQIYLDQSPRHALNWDFTGVIFKFLAKDLSHPRDATTFMIIYGK